MDYIIGDLSEEEMRDNFARDLVPITLDDMIFFRNTNPLFASKFEGFSPLETSLQIQATSAAYSVVAMTDNTVFHGDAKKKTAQSKIKTLNIARTNLGRSTINPEVVTEDNFLRFTYVAKIESLKILRELGPVISERVTLKLHEEAPFIDGLVKSFNGSISHIVQYGNLDGKDIDLIVFVDDINLSFYMDLWQKGRQIFSGIFNKFGEEKPLGVLFLRTDDIPAYAFNSHDFGDLNVSMRQMYGRPLEIPIFEKERGIDLAYAKAGGEYLRLKKTPLKNDVLNAMTIAPRLLDYTLKLELWIKKALLQKEMGECLTKGEFLELEPVQLPTFENPSLISLKEYFVERNVKLAQRVEEHYKRIN